MREAFVDELLKLGGADQRVVVLAGDLGYRLFDAFAAACPNRFINAGIAEQNMISVATGLALSGMKAISYTISAFNFRATEQIRMAAYHKAPIVIVGVGAGMSYSDLGVTHHATSDTAVMRSIPDLQVCCPGDPWEVRAALRCALASDRPTYLRLGKRGEPHVHSGIPAEFSIGRAIDIAPWDDGRVCILACGTILPVAIAAARLLDEQGVCTPDVASFPWAKPLDDGKLAEAFEHYDLVVTIEEHGLIGGFGSAVAEWASDRGVQRGDGAALLRLGTPDSFHCMAGDQNAAREALGLTAANIAARIMDRLA